MVSGALLAGSALLPRSQSGASANTDTLSMYLKLDGNANDNSGDSSNGTVSGATSDAVDMATLNYANTGSYILDGDDSITVADKAELSSSTVTLSAWVKLDTVTGQQAIISKWNTNNNQEYVLIATENDLRMYVGDGADGDEFAEATDVLTAETWHHVLGVYDGSNITVYVDGVAGTPTSTSIAMADTSRDVIVGGLYVDNNPGEFLSGNIDDVRIYSRALGGGEIAELAAGSHTTTTWTGTTSTDYEVAGNWDTGAIPDPYSNVVVPQVTNHPRATAPVALVGLTVNSGARFDLNGNNLTLNDGGVFSNDGTFQLSNSETLTGFANDTDSGTVLISPSNDNVGLRTGNVYNNLHINDSTFAHWTFDDSGDATPDDVSGFDRHLTAANGPTFSTSVAPTNFANDNTAVLDGTDNHYTFTQVNLPANATWCSWVYMTGGTGTILGTNVQSALSIIGGTEVRVYNDTSAQNVSWTGIPSLYNAWHHLCITQTDQSTTTAFSLYIDGVEFQEALPHDMGTGAGAISYVGRGSYDGGSTTDYFTGQIDDMRIFSRALLPTEIAQLSSGELLDTFVSTQTMDASLDVIGDFVLSSGKLDASASNYDIAVGGNVRSDGGVLDNRSNNFVLDGTDQSITGSLSLNNLTKTVASAATLTFGQKSTTTVLGDLTLGGASGNLLSLRSSTDGVQWNINPANDPTVSYLDLQDSNNISGNVIDITDANVTDSGNNVGWEVNVAPDDPSALGPAGYVDGSYGTDTTPNLSFTLTDDNSSDQLSYQIVIDDTSDFSSPIVDYVSDLGAQGSRSYTVGQAGGTYSAGDTETVLASGDYYWQVKAIDNYDSAHESAYAVANSGAIAFSVDATDPDLPGVPSSADSPTDNTPTWTWTASDDTGSGLEDPAYTVDWSKDGTFNSGVSSGTSNTNEFTHSTPLSDGYWYFRVKATDNVGNESEYATSLAHLIDTTNPTTPGSPTTTSPTSITQPTWNWTASSDTGSGLHATEAYRIEWSLDSSFDDLESTVYSAFKATVGYSHTVDLADGTWFFRVQAKDALGNVSAWSASGSVLIDGTPPSVPTQPMTTTPSATNTPAWNWDDSVDAGVGLNTTPYNIQWSSDAGFTPVIGSTTSTTSNYTHGTPLADGTWYIRVSARDSLGSQSAYSVSGTVFIDTTAPSVPGTPTTDPETNDPTPTWNWTPSDDGTGVDLPATGAYHVEWSNDNFGTVAGSADTDSPTFTHSSDLGEGTWQFQVRAKDDLDNTSSYSAAGEVLIDLTPPSTPGEPSTTTPTNNQQPAWSWDASTDATGLADPIYTVEWSDDSFATVAGTEDTNNRTNYVIPETLAEGTWSFRVMATDVVGNETGWSSVGTVLVDVTDPDIPGQPTTTSPNSDNTPDWTWADSDDQGSLLTATPYHIEWSQDSDFLVGVEEEDSASASFTHTDALGEGTWYIRVTATDNAGNTSDESAVGSVLIDTVPPAQPGEPSSTPNPTADSTPAWIWGASNDTGGSGLASPAYIVEWSNDNFGSVFDTDTSGSTSFGHADELADGTWYFRVRAVDLASNESSNSATGSVVVDDTPPGVPGAPTTFSPTADDTPSWSWSASVDNQVGLRTPDGYDVQWSDDNFATVAGSDTTNNILTYVLPTSLGEGTWYIRVRAVDLLDNTSAWSSTGEVLVSTEGPTTPGEPTTATPTTNTMPVWTWSESTSDVDLDTPPYHIQYSQDATFDTGVTTDDAANNSYTHLLPLAEGVWYFKVVAEDETGMFSDESPIGSVHIDTTNPTAPGAPSTTTPENDNTPTWEWAAGTDVGGSGLDADEPYAVEWSQDSGFGSGVESAMADGEAFTHSTPLADGTWYFRAKSVDAASNESAFSINGTIEIDATAPDTPGAPTTTTPTTDTTPEWSWAASNDSGSGLFVPAYAVEWSQDSGFGTSSTDTNDDTTYPHAAELADGLWYFRVRARDNAGNWSGWSAAGQVRVDTTPPVLPGQPSTGGPNTSSVTPTWTWDASTDSGAGLATPAYTVEWDDNSDFSSVTGSDTSATASFTHVTPLTEGDWYFRVRASDVVGNQTGWSANGSVNVDNADPDAPGAPTTASPTADNTPEWTWTAGGDNGVGLDPDEPYEVEWSEDNTFMAGVSNDTSNTTNYTHGTALSDGTWYFRVRSVDAASNVSGWQTNSVIVDITAPTGLGNLSTPDVATTSSTPEWTWDAANDSGTGLFSPAYEIQWSLDNTFASGVTTDTSDDVSYTSADYPAVLSDGTWYFQIRARDNVGNWTAWSSAEQVVVDGTAPVISALAVVTNPTSTTVSWTTSENATDRVEYGAGNYSSIKENFTNPDSTAHSLLLEDLTPCSTYQYVVKSRDALDNERVSASGSFTTTSCSGNATIMSQGHAVVDSSGGALSLDSGSADLNLSIPPSILTESLDFQAKQLSPSAALTPTGIPDEKRLVGNHVYDLKAIDSDNAAVTTFGGNVVVTIGYTSSEVTNISELGIYRNDGTSWHKLTSCTLNPSSRTVGCPTDEFSVFGLFGTYTAPVSGGGSEDSGSDSEPVQEEELPEGEGTTEPEPEMPPEIKPGDKAEDEPEAEAASDSRGISSTITTAVKTVVSRPIWWVSLLLLAGAIVLIIVLRRRRDKKSPNYGIHKED